MIKLHVNSSLPRSGSELCQSLLHQNSQIYASPSSPLLEYWFAALGNFTMSEVKSQNQLKMQKAFTNFCKQGADGYYTSLTNRNVIVDKSRGWLQYAELLWTTFPDAKIVTMIRKIDDIVASLEKIYRQHPAHPETRHLPKTPEQRAKYWMTSGNLPLGLALDRLKDRQARGKDNRILYVDYDNLVKEPVEVMKTVFAHFDVEPIEIDPLNVKKAVEEDDSHFGIFGKHEVRSIVKKI